MGDQGSLTFQLYRSGEQLVIRAQDTGKGVVAEELPHLFESFYRTDKARVNVAGGSGLGLAIVRHIIEAMQGSVRAEQVPEGGLRIVMTFPWQERREKK
jgi:signal transduction histidine kinase